MALDFSDKTYTCLTALGLKICVSTVTHPFEYAKFLIQIGHEPLPSYTTRTFFGRPVEALPNIFKYVKYIKETDGLLGCYRGFGTKIAGQVISTLVAENVTQNVDEYFPGDHEVDENEKRWYSFKKQLSKDLVSKSVTIVVSQPFFVISCRAMSQFIGGEDTYEGFFNSIKDIFRRDGLTGFFSGLVPRWLGEITAVLLSSFIIYGVNRFLVQDIEIRSFSTPTIQYICSTLTYPFHVVTACMVVNNCGLAGGAPPQMPIYDSWSQCWKDLYTMGQLNRGSSTLIRYLHRPPSSRKLLKYTY